MKNFAPQTRPVLIVDDEKDICYLLNAIMKKRSLPSKLAGSLAEAEKVLETESPYLIFLDNHLPDGLGIDHISRLKQKLPGTPIVVISAHDNATDRNKAYQQGANFFISKPFTMDVIIKALEKIQDSGVA